MEYLTLQDIPQRHCHPVHSHRMSHSAERSLGNMAAVRQDFSSPLPEHARPIPLHPPTPTLPTYGYAVRERRESMASENHPPLEHIELPSTPTMAASPRSPHTPSHTIPDLFIGALNADMRGLRERFQLVDRTPQTVTIRADLSHRTQCATRHLYNLASSPFRESFPHSTRYVLELNRAKAPLTAAVCANHY
jgi:hypothetical protein